MTRLLIATTALALVAVCLAHSAMAQTYFGAQAPLGGVGGRVAPGPGMQTCNPQVSEECRKVDGREEGVVGRPDAGERTPPPCPLIRPS